MREDNICYCGNYGGGKHTKSARCDGSPEPTPEPLPSNSKLRVIEPYRSPEGVTAEVFFTKLGGTGAVVLNDTVPSFGEQEIVLGLREAHDLMLWLQCALGLQSETFVGRSERIRQLQAEIQEHLKEDEPPAQNGSEQR